MRDVVKRRTLDRPAREDDTEGDRQPDRQRHDHGDRREESRAQRTADARHAGTSL